MTASKLTDKRAQAALTALENGCTMQAAAGYAGVSRQALYGWMDRDPDFRAAVEQAQDKAESSFTAAVVAAVPKNWQAAAWWLERRRHADYGRRDRVEMSIDIRTLAERVAGADGLDADQLIAEAERILASA